MEDGEKNFYAMVYVPFSFQLSCTLVPMKQDEKTSLWIPSNPDCQQEIDLFRKHAPYRQLIHRRDPENHCFQASYEKSQLTQEEWNVLGTWHAFADLDEDVIPCSMEKSHVGLLKRYQGWPPRSAGNSPAERIACLTPWMSQIIPLYFPELPSDSRLVGWTVFECEDEENLTRPPDPFPFVIQYWRKNVSGVPRGIGEWITKTLQLKDHHPENESSFLVDSADQHDASWGFLRFARREDALQIMEHSNDPQSEAPVLCKIPFFA